MKNKPWFRIDRISPPDEMTSYLRLAYGHPSVEFSVRMELEDKPYKLSEFRQNKQLLMRHFIMGAMGAIGAIEERMK